MVGMNKEEFMSLMRFPREWLIWGMYPDELFVRQLEGYEPGHEDGSEHDRHGALHWWIRKGPDKQELEYLIRLAMLDPDNFMADDAFVIYGRAKALTRIMRP